MTRRTRILIRVAAAVLAFIAIAIISVVLVVRTGWFRNYVREKMISYVEDATGGKVDVQAFRFDWRQLQAEVTGFVIHGTEPAGSAPLFEAPRIVLRLKLFTGWKKPVDLEYLGVDRPSTDVIVFPDGHTNLPTPKVARKPSGNSGLETVVNLAIDKFEIRDGQAQFADQKVAFNARGQNLRAELAYNSAAPGYQGTVSMDPLYLSSGNRPPMNLKVTLPLNLRKDEIRIANGRIETPESNLTLTAAVQHLASPDISGQLNTHIALDEVARSFAVPLHVQRDRGPQSIDASIGIQSGNGTLNIQEAKLALGQTTLEASGTLEDPSGKSAADINGKLSLAELGELFQVAARPQGTVLIAGKAKLNGRSSYLLTANIDARNVSLQQGNIRFSNIGLSSGIRVDPAAIQVKDLKLTALGGELRANARLENFAAFKVNGALSGFDLRTVAASAGSKAPAYGAVISGTIAAQGNLKARAEAGLLAEAHLAVAPSTPGVPVSGRINVNYVAASDLISIGDSQIVLPNTRIDFSGDLGQQAQMSILSQNLNDFLPAVALVSPTTKQLPIALHGGAANLVVDVRGPLKTPQISSHLSVTGFEIEHRPFDRLAADLTASPSGASLQNGALTRKTLQANFSGSIGLHDWSTGPRQPLQATATIHNGDLADILALAGESSLRARGSLSASARISGTMGNPQGTVDLSVANGAVEGEPLDRLQLSAAVSDQLVNLRSVELAAPAGRIDMHGTFTHPRDSFTQGRVYFHAASNQIQLSKFETLQQQRPGLAGAVSLDADISGDLRAAGATRKFAPSNINADFKAIGIRDQAQNYGDLTATVRTNSSQVNAHVDSDFVGSTIQWTSQTELTDDYPTTADTSVQGLSIGKIISLAAPGEIQASGVLSARAHATGTLENPHANLTFALTTAEYHGQPLGRVAGAVDYTNQLINVSDLQIASPAGRIDLKGSLSAGRSGFASGRVNLNLATSNIDLSKVQAVQNSRPGLTGTLRLLVDASADLRLRSQKQKILLSRLNTNAAINQIEWNGQALGNVTVQGETKGNLLSVKMDSDFAKSSIHAAGTVRLQADYPVDAKLTFANVTYSGLENFLETSPEVRPSFDAITEGQVTLAGPATRLSGLRGDLRISRLELLTAIHTGSSAGSKRTILQNQEPIAAHLERSVVHIQSARLAGRSTQISLTGTAALDQNSPFSLAVNANTNLALLKDIYRDAYASGAVVMNATAHGTRAQPLVNGKIELHDASLNLGNWPTGISNANGVIALNGTGASITQLNAECGGGKLSLAGYMRFTGAVLAYNLRATGNLIRTRYAGATVVANASINLSGTSAHSVLGGDITIQRVGFNQQSDLGSILSQSSTPAQAPPSAPTGIIAGMVLNVRIRTAPGMQFESSLAKSLEAEGDLTLRGTLLSPGMVGRINITAGTLIFFGNQYTVNRGSISFFNPLKIEPVLDIDLETSVQSVDVILGVSGPIDDLKLSYRSDPPLKFEDIIALLATGRTPPDPTIAAHQPFTPDQSAGQMGESAIVSQAIANPIANRLQRVFGVSQLKIDPTFASGSALPQARLTLQQQVTPYITFTYTQDLTQSNAQIIRIEWAFSPRFSAVATRDVNGIFGVDFFYKKRFR
ncbi:MAG TPA: translocation/assembly module TamB domain-containing protein [Bryobacteraceae bacterium]|nr:translocation/assembly module TamB domain-containing protein [Bryobacteraceae bacterium]